MLTDTVKAPKTYWYIQQLEHCCEFWRVPVGREEVNLSSAFPFLYSLVHCMIGTWLWQRLDAGQVLTLPVVLWSWVSSPRACLLICASCQKALLCILFLSCNKRKELKVLFKNDTLSLTPWEIGSNIMTVFLHIIGTPQQFFKWVRLSILNLVNR